MPREGKTLEQLVTAIEIACAGKSNVQITSPKRLTDKITGKPREHDVVIEVSQNHRTVVIAIECRDRSKPVGAPAIEEFRQKCLDTGVDKGVVVSAHDFTKTARIKAKAYGIQCLDLARATIALDWFLPSTVESVHRNLRVVEIRMIPPPETEKPGIEDVMALENAVGQRAQKDEFVSKIINYLASKIDLLISDSAEEKTHRVLVHLRVQDRLRMILTNGSEIPVIELQCKCIVQLTRSFVPVETLSYSEQESGKMIREIVAFPVSFGSTEGKMLFSKQPGADNVQVTLMQPKSLNR